MTSLRRAWHDEEGSALVELALALPLLAVVLAGVVDFGLYAERKMQVTEAANAAAAYGAVAGNQLNTTAIQNAGVAASPSLAGLTVSATTLWTCSPSGASVSSTSTCPGYGTPVQYVKVSAQATVNAPMPLPVFGSSMTVRSQATYRVRWKPL